jgi:immune inhibitor A
MKTPYCYSQLGTTVPTQCVATEQVLRSIREEIRANAPLSMGDSRLATLMGFASGEVSLGTGFNDGVFYPPAPRTLLSQGPLAAPASGTALSGPRVGTMHALALLVDFSDNPGAATSKHFSDLLFDATNPDSMTSYYHDISYGQLKVTGEATTWLRMPNPYSYYTNGQSGMGGYPQNSQGLLEDALKVFCQKDNLKRFDADGDGYVDGIFLIHAGGGAEADPISANRPNKIWSHKWTLPQPFTNNGVSVYAYSTEPEDGHVGVFAHEFGHVLGLPDLYDTSYRSRGVGDWCIMSGGSWGNNGLNPVRMSCWCLKELGWVNPTTIPLGLIRLDTLANSQNNCFKINLTPGGLEYFLLENKQQTGHDTYLPGSGLAIWHIDETRPANDNPPFYRVGLVEADGRQDLETNANGGDTSDLFPGSANVSLISDTTNPSLKSRNGAPSGRSIGQIVDSGGIITATVV